MSASIKTGAKALLLAALFFSGAVNLHAGAAETASAALSKMLSPGPAVQPGQTATLLPDGTWLLLGGTDASGAPIASAFQVDPRTGKARQLGTLLSIARAGHSATLLPDGSVLVLGGVQANGAIARPERFDPASGASAVLEPLGLIARTQHTATLLVDGRLLIAGGLDERGNALYDVELFDAIAGKVESFNAKLDDARLADLAALLPSGAVLLWGGVDVNGTPLPGAELYDPREALFLPYTAENAVALAAELENPSPPAVLGTDPAEGDSDVGVDKVLAIRFSKRLDVTTVNDASVVLVGPSGAVAAKVVPAADGVLAFVAPVRELLPDTAYTLFIKGAKDLRGQELPFAAVGFRTAPLVPRTSAANDSSAPVVQPSPSAPMAQPAGKEKPEKPPVAGGAVANDEWIPSALNFKGDWRTGLARQRSQLTLPRRSEVLRAIHGIGSKGAGSSVPPGVTAVAGQVLLLSGRPLPNVTLSIGDSSVLTDANGEFLLSEAPSGSQTLVIDGGTASADQKQYGRYEYHMNVRAGELNALPFVIWMTRLDTAHAVSIASPTTGETVVTSPRIPGLELRIPAGKVIRDADGKIVTRVSITPIPVDQPPFPLPNVPVPIYFTIQPGGAHLADVAGTGYVGARLVYPNFTGAAPGERMDFWNYDSRDRGWYVYGQGSVGADGRQIVPDPGVVIYEFTGAMIGLPSNAPGKGAQPGGCRDGDPVDCYTGLFLHERVDLRIADVIPIEVGRVYQSGDSATRSFGRGTMLSYDLFLVGDTFPYTYQDLILPDGGRIHYVRTSQGTSNVDAVYQHTATHTAFYGSTLYWDGAGWTLQLRDGMRYKFIDSFQTTNFRKSGPYQIIDRFGNTVNLIRDWSTSELTQIVSPNGRRITLSYDSSMRITQAQDDIGRTVVYTYDTSGRLASVTDPENGVEQYTYDANHRMLTVVDKRNHTMVTNTYDANGRVAAQTYADNTTNTFSYTLDGSGKVTQTDVTDERGEVKRLVFNSGGYPVTITRALGQAEEQTITNELQPGTNLLLSQTDALGRKTAYQYDAIGNVTRMTLLDGTQDTVSINYTYEPTYNQVATVTDPLSHTTSFQYDELGNLISITDPLNHTTQIAHNAAGQVESVTDGLNHTTSFSYAAGDLVSLTDPLGRTVSFGRDAAGRAVSVTDALGNRSETAYDGLDRVTSRTDALGQQASFGYDANGNLTSFTDARNNVTAFAYDARDRLITKTDALSQAESYQYDAAGNLVFVTDRKGQVTGFTYDLLGRRTQAGFAASSTTSPVYQSTITYTYDDADRLIQIVDSANGTISRTYDDRFDAVAQETTPQGTVSYGYDAAGRRASMTASGGTQAAYTYDDAGRLTQISQGTSTVQFAYDAASRRTSLTLANGITVSYGYDNANQVTSIAYRDGANNLLGDLTYAYDNAGRRTSMGGSFARTNLPAAMASAVYDANNRVTSWDGASLSHDANGNLLGFQGDSYAWNSRDELYAITGTNSASFQYDALGRRGAKTVAGTARQFLYDGLNPIQELSGTTVTANVLTGLGIDEYLMRSEGSSVEHYLTDALGSTIRLTDGSAAKLVDYTYEPYGKASADAASTNSFQFTGRENDGTGLNYYRARYQSPVLGRFISEDPIGLAGSENLYAYVANDPISLVDPEGLIATWWNANLRPDPGIGIPQDPIEQAVQVGAMGKQAMTAAAVPIAATGVAVVTVRTGGAAMALAAPRATGIQRFFIGQIIRAFIRGASDDPAINPSEVPQPPAQMRPVPGSGASGGASPFGRPPRMPGGKGGPGGRMAGVGGAWFNGIFYPCP